MNLDETPVLLPLDDRPGPAEPAHDLQVERLVQASLEAWRPPPRRIFLMPPQLAAAAALIVLLPLGAWAAGVAVRAWTEPSSAPPADPLRATSSTTATEPGEPPVPSVGAKDAGADTGLEAQGGYLGTPGTAAPPHGEEVAPRTSPSRRRAPPRRPDEGAERSPDRALPPPAGVAVGDARVPTLTEASAARRAGRWRAAAELYGVLRRRGRPAEAHVAAVAEGQLRLEKLEQPGLALVAFDAALSALPGGPLAAEASLGRGDALAGLGRRREAAQVWRRLVEAHPSSVAGQAARERLRRP